MNLWEQEVAVHRRIFAAVIAAFVLIAAGLALALRASDSPQPASRVVAEGRVTGTDGKPVRGIKVWLNAWPRSAEAQALQAGSRPVPVTVVSSVITSAAGRYAIRVSSSATLPEVARGVIKFSVMTGNSAGWDTASFAWCPRPLGRGWRCRRAAPPPPTCASSGK
jgi:hypothetical protein